MMIGKPTYDMKLKEFINQWASFQNYLLKQYLENI